MEFRKKISKEEYQNLKSSLKAYAAAATAIRQAAVGNNGDTRYKLRNLKRDMGQEARPYQIAMAFLKGKRYLDVEPNTEKFFDSLTLANLLRWRITKEYKESTFTKDLELFFMSKESEEYLKEQEKINGDESCCKTKSSTLSQDKTLPPVTKPSRAVTLLGNLLKSIAK